jgi:hypothetical protein
MQNNFRWIAFTLPLAVALIGAATTVQAFTDSNAALKEAAADAQGRVVVIGKAVPAPARTAWVPVSPKRLDGFRPVMPVESPAARTTLAKADVPAARR